METLHQRVATRLLDLEAMLPLHIRMEMQPIEVEYYRNKRVAGQCCGPRNIRISQDLLEQDTAEILTQTVGHEYAHCVVRQVHNRSQCKPHGVEWRRIMELLELPADVLHSMDTSFAPPRKRQRRYIYACACTKTHKIPTQTAMKMMRGHQVRTCRVCNTTIQPTGEVIKI